MPDHPALNRLRLQTERLAAKTCLLDLETAKLRQSSKALLQECDGLYAEISRLAGKVQEQKGRDIGME